MPPAFEQKRTASGQIGQRQSLASLAVLALLLIASVVVLADLSHGLTFFQDTWAFLMHRQDFTADAFLAPHNEHIVLIPVALEKAMIALFGMDSATPEYVLLIAMLTATAVVFYLYLRRRVGPWPATIAAALVLFLGPAWTVLLWPFQTGFVGALGVGIAMLLALDREDRVGDRIACLLLLVSLAFSSLGLSFACAAAVNVLLRARDRGLRRAYIVAIPLALFAVWYLGWGRDAESHLSLLNVLRSPFYVAEGLAATIENLVGLTNLPVEGPGDPLWGWPLLAGLVVAAVIWKRRHPGFSPRLLSTAAALASFWFLAAFNYTPGREAIANRYAYAGSILLLLFLADLFAGARPRRAVLAVAGVLAAAAIVSNVVRLDEGSDRLHEQTVLTRADLGAIDLAQNTVPPTFMLVPEIAGTPSLIDINAAEYLPAMREHGSPGYSAAELREASATARRQADIVLSAALPISAATGAYRENPPPGLRCTLVPSAAGPFELPAPGPVTRIEVGPGPAAEVSLRRFTTGEFPIPTEGVPGASALLIRIPRDRSAQRWQLQITAPQGGRVCARP